MLRDALAELSRRLSQSEECTEVKTAQSVCTEVYRSVRVLRGLNGVQEVASSVAKQSEDA